MCDRFISMYDYKATYTSITRMAGEHTYHCVPGKNEAMSMAKSAILQKEFRKREEDAGCVLPDVPFHGESKQALIAEAKRLVKDALTGKNLNQFMNMDHMFIMRLAACFLVAALPVVCSGKSGCPYPVPAVDTCRNSCCTCHHSGQVVVPASGCRFRTSSSFFQREGQKAEGQEKALLSLHATGGTIIRYYYWFSNFLVYGGAGSGKTESIGKPLMEQCIRSGFAGFIYDFKVLPSPDCIQPNPGNTDTPMRFYYVNFTDMNRIYRFNPLDRKNIKDRTMLMQLMEDVLGALMPPTSSMVYRYAWHPERRGIQALGRVPGMLHAAAYR